MTAKRIKKAATELKKKISECKTKACDNVARWIRKTWR